MAMVFEFLATRADTSASRDRGCVPRRRDRGREGAAQRAPGHARNTAAHRSRRQASWSRGCARTGSVKAESKPSCASTASRARKACC